MASTVHRESLNEMIAEQRAKFGALKADGKVTPEVAALLDTLLAMMEMLIMLLLEKKTRKTSANSSLPGSLTPFDQTAPAKAGAKG